MKARMLALLIVGVGVGAAPHSGGRKLEAAIQGEWVVETVAFCEAKKPFEKLVGRKATLEADRLTLPAPSDQECKVTFEVNGSRRPATIDLFSDGKLVTKGIFSLDRDTLTLCLGQTLTTSDGPGTPQTVSAEDRPTKFDSRQGILFTLRRPRR